MIITSASNEKIKEVKKLVKSSRERNEHGVYIVEGVRMFREIPEDCLAEVYVSETFEDKYAKELSKFSVEPCIVADKVFNSMSDTNTPQGVLALVKMKRYSLDDICCGNNGCKPFILIIERLQDPGNLGTIIRAAEGAGVTGILLSGDSVDIYNPKVVRSTMGSVFRMPVCISKDFISDINLIRKNGITIYGAHLDGRDFYNKNLTKACGFLIGNEGNGLSDEVSALSDELIKIPMMGKVESLNAATSAAVISYEVLRQRKYSL